MCQAVGHPPLRGALNTRPTAPPQPPPAPPTLTPAAAGLQETVQGPAGDAWASEATRARPQTAPPPSVSQPESLLLRRRDPTAGGSTAEPTAQDWHRMGRAGFGLRVDRGAQPGRVGGISVCTNQHDLVDRAARRPLHPWKRITTTHKRAEDTKTQICTAFDTVVTGVSLNTNLTAPGGPGDTTGAHAVAANARIALIGGGQYLLNRL